jgi:hypothetical protein
LSRYTLARNVIGAICAAALLVEVLLRVVSLALQSYIKVRLLKYTHLLAFRIAIRKHGRQMPKTLKRELYSMYNARLNELARQVPSIGWIIKEATGARRGSNNERGRSNS